ncbi:MAG: ATP-binding cassette domain-containing protein [Coriobacteriales bacterium]|jgi:macrolide transport system ATP-binding/permease protein
MQLNLTSISYSYPGSAVSVLRGVTATFPEGWTGIIGDNGCGKSTLARIATGELSPDAGSVSPKLVSAYCEQDVNIAPSGLEDFACAWDREAVSLRTELSIDDEWAWRYDELSCGQKKRLQVAVALWERPDLLVVDEPTNHLDAAARGQVLKVLSDFRGIGLLISHDRALLDSLVTRCAFIEDGRLNIKPGTYSQALELVRSDDETRTARRDKARREEKRIAQEHQRRVEEASRSHGLRSKSGLSSGDHDARERIGRAVATGKDGKAAHLSKVMAAREKAAHAQASQQFVKRRYDGEVPQFGRRSTRSVLAQIPEGMLSFDGSKGDGKTSPGVKTPRLFVGSDDHIGIVGPNGAGKSTLVRALVDSIDEGVETIYLPQEIDEAQANAALGRLRELPPEQRGRVLSVVAQLNSEPQGLLDGGAVSPGELRKLLIAQGVLSDVEFLVMDEPTNHLDIHSVEALERRLMQFPGALVLVSHDERAISSSCTRIWELEPCGDGSSQLVER